ncbi:DUF6193 family natural product biosynthesis protein [Streptomyces sp. NPDC051219]|uniref:DUF6193 family natural product biosynthesis protein n=1 Tax=Streptomyces sp. NPDC051219 TaxID=3155283 RepID=UPI003438B20A
MAKDSGARREPDQSRDSVDRSREPRLRELFPLINHGSLHLSRCTQCPWTSDVGALYRHLEGVRVRPGGPGPRARSKPSISSRRSRSSQSAKAIGPQGL